MQETGTLPPPHEPSEREKRLVKQLLDEATEIEKKLPDVEAAARTLAILGYDYLPARGPRGLDKDPAAAYVRGMVAGIRRAAYAIVRPPSQGIA